MKTFLLLYKVVINNKFSIDINVLAMSKKKINYSFLFMEISIHIIIISILLPKSNNIIAYLLL